MVELLPEDNLMAAPDFLVFDGGTSDEGTELPRRPSIDDLGGDEKVDDAEFPPDPVEHPTAAGHNQIVKVTAAHSRVAAACKIEVRFDGSGVPYVARATALGSTVTLATFTALDGGTGITSITWPADTFPLSVCSPTGLTPLVDTSDTVTCHAFEITNGVKVWTKQAGSLANIPFTITIN